ncbi:MAG: HEAT repeat domain-containing protein [Acidobacteriota bacterium]
MHNRPLLLAFPLLIVMTLVACGQAKPGANASKFQIQAPILYEQCASLEAGGQSKEFDQELGKLKSADLKTRSEAAERLAGRCEGRAVAPLLTMLREDKDALGRAAAARALGKLGDREAIDPMREAIADPAWEVRLAIGPALSSFQVHRASYDVLNQLVNPNSMTVIDEGDLYARCQAVLAVNQLRDVNFSRKSVHFLFFFLDNETNPVYKEMALATLTELKNTRNGPHEFVGVLKQNLNPLYRIKAADWIGRLGIASGEEALIETAANDRDPRVRDAASAALVKLKQLSSGK